MGHFLRDSWGTWLDLWGQQSKCSLGFLISYVFASSSESQQGALSSGSPISLSTVSWRNVCKCVNTLSPTQPPHSPTPLQQKEWPEPELIPLCFATTQRFFQVLDSAPLCFHPNVISTCYSYETECIVIILIVRNPKKTHVSHHSVWSSLVRPALIAPHSLPPSPSPPPGEKKLGAFCAPAVCGQPLCRDRWIFHPDLHLHYCPHPQSNHLTHNGIGDSSVLWCQTYWVSASKCPIDWDKYALVAHFQFAPMVEWHHFPNS